MTKPNGAPDPRVARFLGPAEPELSCEACFDQLDAFVELELARGHESAAAANPEMVAHLEGCPACREDAESLAALLREDANR